MEIIYSSIIIISLAGMLAQWIGWKLKTPSIVFLLLFGFIVGPITGMLEPREFLGDLLRPVTSLAVAIILFEGALHLNFKELRQNGRMTLQLIFGGGMLRWFLISVSAHYLAGLSWEVSIIFGAILIVTGPTVIIPLLKQAKLGKRVSNALKWEGIVNDPIGAILAILVYEFFAFSSKTELPISAFIGEMIIIVIAVCFISYALGLLIAEIVERSWLPEYLISPFLFSTVIILYIFCDVMLHEAGLIAVTVLGITLANKEISALNEIKRFKENLTILLVSGIFIILTADLELSLVTDVSLGGILFILSVIFVVRPISAFISSLGTDMSKEEIAITGWLAPRGIVCAAISGLMASLLVDLGYNDAEQLLPLAFYIVILTVVLHGLSADKLAKSLGVSSSSTSGLLIVGASNWASDLAANLQKEGIPVMIASTNWRKLKDARLNNIPVYYGDVMSEDTEYNIELSNYTTMLAATDNPAYNALTCNRFVGEFNRDNVFQLSLNDDDIPERLKTQKGFMGRLFLSGAYDYFYLWRLFREGWRFTTTRISKQFSLEDFKEEYSLDGEKPIIAGLIKKNKNFRLFSDPKSEELIKDDDHVIALVKTKGEEEMKEELLQEKKNEN